MPKQSVLVIDDEDVIRDAVRMALNDAGYTVLEASNGTVGHDLLQRSAEPLVVLLDLMMPRMSGIGVLRAVADEPEVANRHAFIIFSASRAFDLSTLIFYLPGKRLFDLPKPFDLDHLIDIVEQAVQELDGARAGGGDDTADQRPDTAVEGEPVHVQAPRAGDDAGQSEQ